MRVNVREIRFVAEPIPTDEVVNDTSEIADWRGRFEDEIRKAQGYIDRGCTGAITKADAEAWLAHMTDCAWSEARTILVRRKVT